MSVCGDPEVGSRSGRGDDGYLYGLFLSSSLCLRLPNRAGYGYLADTTAALENRSASRKVVPPSNSALLFIYFLMKANLKHTI